MGVGFVFAYVSASVSSSESTSVFEFASVSEIVSISKSGSVFVYYMLFGLSYTLSFLAHSLLLIFPGN